MRARASLLWRAVTAVAFGVTAALAVTLNGGAPVNAALTSVKGTTGAPHPSPPVTARCAAAGLRISLGPGARLTAALTRYPLEFTNVSGARCVLAGYPQVAAYRGDGVLFGPAAVRDPSVPGRRILLAPGQTAHAVLDAIAPARCRPVRASGLRVVAPGQTAARYVRQPLTTCAVRAARGQQDLLVGAIQPGVGTRAGGGTSTLADGRPRPAAARQSPSAS
jgi:Domain of unknown function (DUF4232)